MNERTDNFLFESLNKAYSEERKKYEDTTAEAKNRSLLARAREIVRLANQDSSDNVSMQRGAYEEGDTLTITPATLKYGSLIEVGESAVVKQTEWIDYGQREIAGNNVNLSIRLVSHDFTRITADGPATRLGPVALEGKATDSDGVSVEVLFAQIGEYDGTARLLYNFSNDILPSTDDYNEVERMISQIEQAVK